MAYTITGRKSGVVRFEPGDNGNVNRESESLTSRVTSNPIESGSDINDHVINEQGKLNITGIIIGGNEAIAALKAMREKRDIVAYAGRSRVDNLVFTSLSFDYESKNKVGCAFKASFQAIQIESPEVVEVGSIPMTTQDTGKAATPQAAKTANAGTQTTTTQIISGAAYASYVDSYRGNSNSGPTTRATASYNGV